MVVAFLGLVAVSVMIGVLDWRRGVLLCVPIGFLADPIRKLAPGQSVIWVITVAICFVACLLGAVLRGEPSRFRGILNYYAELRAPVALFAAIVVAQSVATLMRLGSPILAGLGFLSYLSPLLALLLACRFCSERDAFARWRRLYISGGVVVAIAVGLQFSGVESALFKSIGVDIVYGTSGVVRMMCGIMRSSEIAGFHLATALCLVLVAVVIAETRTRRSVAAFVAALLFSALLLTGRRKMLGEVGLFVVFFGALLARHRGGLSKGFQAAILIGVVGLLGLQLTSRNREIVVIPYLERGVTILAESADRLEHMTIRQFGTILERNGILGSGAGTGAQGAQYFGGGAELVGSAAEGGLGKILAELGVPGMLALGWLAAAFAKVLRRLASGARSLPFGEAVRVYGLVSIVPANLAVFVTAHQVYGDPFVLIVLGWLTGAALASPSIARATARADEDRSRGSVAAEPVGLTPMPGVRQQRISP
ncbi:MAG: hypothetical protein AMXMBFR36_17800 [Acidobacteriota bacterium]